MRHRIIGILGGMGPAAGARFLSLFVREMQRLGACEDADFPRTVYLGLPMIDFSARGAEDKEEVSRQVANGVAWLLRNGAELIAVPCCSVHEFYPFGSESKYVLNIIDETLARCDGNRLAIMCSRQSREAKLFERPNNICYYGHQEMLDISIAKVMSGEEVTLSGMLDPFYYKMGNADAFRIDAFVLGCTELSLGHQESPGSPVIDASQCLAEALARRVTG